jgi:glyoxylase-like metal-dependent hydrolase (beta-lactamase superfamily II)
MANYRIYPVKLGTITRPVSNMLHGSADRSPFGFPLIAYYLEGGGHKILVDTGGTPPAEGGKWQPYTRLAEEEMDAALAAVGADADGVDIVLLTHLHWDHASNNHFFKNARFIVQAAELAVIAGDGEVKGYEVEVARRTQYEAVDGDVEIVPGVSVVLVPGHSAGLQAVVVDTAEGPYLITGDIVPRYGNWTADPKIPNGSYEDMDAMMASYRKLAALGIDRILPGHEPLVFGQRCYPAL